MVGAVDNHLVQFTNVVTHAHSALKVAAKGIRLLFKVDEFVNLGHIDGHHFVIFVIIELKRRVGHEQAARKAQPVQHAHFSLIRVCRHKNLRQNLLESFEGHWLKTHAFQHLIELFDEHTARKDDLRLYLGSINFIDQALVVAFGLNTLGMCPVVEGVCSGDDSVL